ncbi:Hypothetical_protein [Hexamita inflata]
MKYELKTARFALTYRPLDIFWEINRGSVSEQGWGSAFEVMQQCQCYKMSQMLQKSFKILQFQQQLIYHLKQRIKQVNHQLLRSIVLTNTSSVLFSKEQFPLPNMHNGLNNMQLSNVSDSQVEQIKTFLKQFENIQIVISPAKKRSSSRKSTRKQSQKLQTKQTIKMLQMLQKKTNKQMKHKKNVQKLNNLMINLYKRI